MDIILRLENFTGNHIKDDPELYTLLKRVWVERGLDEKELESGNISLIIEKLKEGDDLENTSYVPTSLVKQLLKEYLEHIKQGLNKDEALEKVYQENKTRVSREAVTHYVSRQKEIYEKLLETFSGEPKEVIEAISIEQVTLERIVGKEAAEKIVREKEFVSEKIREVNAEVKIDTKARELTNPLIFKDVLIGKKEAVETVKKTLRGEGEKTKAILENYLSDRAQIKVIELEGERWILNNVEDFLTLKRRDLKEKIEDKIFDNNKEATMEEVKAVKEYSKLVTKVCYPATSSIREYEKEIKDKAQKDGLDKNQIDEAWVNTSVLSTVLKMQSSQLNDFLDKFKSLKSKIGRVKLPMELTEIRSVERMVELIQFNEEIKNLVALNQKVVQVYDNVDGFVGEKLQNIGMKRIGNAISDRMGLQTMGNFVSESFSIISKKGTKEGITAILKGILSGGVKAASVSTATTVEVGGVAAAQAVPVVGQIILVGTVVLGVVKKIYNKIIKPIITGVKNFFEKLGIDVSVLSLNTKKFFQEHLGKFFGSVVDIGIKSVIALVAIPGILLAAPLTFLIGPIVMFVVVGFIIYSTLTSNLISSLVPPLSMSGGDSSIELPGGTTPANLPESCPGGWPSSQGCILQGPQTSWTHQGLEAIDIGCLSYGDSVYTTHDGVATPLWTSGCGYGMDVYSTCNGVKFYTHFCHFPYQTLNGTTQVKKGDKIGVVDDTGYSFGNHIHYDLKALGNINDYLPTKVPEGCLNFVACGSIYIH